MLRINLSRGALTPRSVLPSSHEPRAPSWSTLLRAQQRRDRRLGGRRHRAFDGSGGISGGSGIVDSFATAATAAAVEENFNPENNVHDAEIDDELDDDDNELDDAYDEDSLAFIPQDELEREAFDDLGDDLEEEPAAGPRSIVLAGFLEGEAAACRALLDGAGFSDVAVLPAEDVDALSLTVRDAILGGGLREPDWALPRGGSDSNDEDGGRNSRPPPAFSSGAPIRAALFGGLSPRDQALALDALESAGLPRMAVAEADELSWASKRVGEVLAEAAAEQGLLVLGGGGGGGGGSGGGRAERRQRQAATTATASDSTAPPPPPPPTAAVVDPLSDVEQAIRAAERAAGGRIQTVNASAAAGRPEPSAAPPGTETAQMPTWQAEAVAAGPALLDSLRDNIVGDGEEEEEEEEEASIEVGAESAERDDDDEIEESEEEEEEEEATTTLLDALVSDSKPSSSKPEEEETDYLDAYLKAVTAADAGPLPETDSSPVFSTSTAEGRAAAKEKEKEEEEKRKQKKKASTPFSKPRTSIKGFGGGKEKAEKKKRAEREGNEDENEDEEQAPLPSLTSSFSQPSPPDADAATPRPEPITIAPVGLEPEEVLLHDRITEELHQQFRAMPQSDREALRERMREEAREPTKDAIVAAVSCGLSYEEICEMVRVASDAAKEAEEGLGVRWSEMAKTKLEPSAEELALARARAGGGDAEEEEEEEIEEEEEE